MCERGEWLRSIDTPSTKKQELLREKLVEIQGEVKEWTLRNFGQHSADDPLIGLVEELGELATAQNTMVASPVTDDAPLEYYVDALGDMTIYLLDYCNQVGWDIDTVYRTRKKEVWEPCKGLSWVDRMTWAVGKMCHAHLKLKQGIRGNAKDLQFEGIAHAGALLWLMRECCMAEWNVELEYIVEDVWAKVRERDWKKYPESGTK